MVLISLSALFFPLLAAGLSYSLVPRKSKPMDGKIVGDIVANDVPLWIDTDRTGFQSVRKIDGRETTLAQEEPMRGSRAACA